MMISPQLYSEMMQDKSYSELCKERDRLIRDIRHFEKTTKQAGGIIEYDVHPSPDVVYQMNLEYLSAICPMIGEKWREEFEYLDD